MLPSQLALLSPLSPLQQLRQRFSDALLPGLWTRDGVRLNGAGTVAGVDDARCATSTGRALFPGVSSANVSLGSRAEFDGLSKMTLMVWFTYNDTGATTSRTIISRYGVSAALQQFLFDVSAGTLRGFVGDGTNVPRYSGSTTLVAGNTYKATLVFDGAAAAGSHVKLYLAARQNDGSYSADAQEVTSPTGTEIATLSSGSGVAVMLGSLANGLNPALGMQDDVRVWLGQALSLAAIQAETLSASTAHHRWTFNGGYTDSGTVAGWGGTASSGLALCSDDTRWGPILMGGGGTANPAWDATNRLVLTDGITQYLRSVFGSALGQSYATLDIATLPSVSGSSSKIVTDLGVGASPIALRYYRAQTTGNLVADPSSSSAFVPAAVSGLRAVFARRTQSGGNATLGIQLGSGAEVAITSAQAAAAPTRLTIGGSSSDTPTLPADVNWAATLVYNSDFAGKQSLAYAWAQSLGAQL